MRQDRANTNKLAQQITLPYLDADFDYLQQELTSASTDLGGRLLVLDQSGKVQADSLNQLNGSRFAIAETASILVSGQHSAYGVHTTSKEAQEAETFNLLRLLQPFDGQAEWSAYCASALLSDDEIIGALVYASPIQDMMQRVFSLQDRMVLYFLIAAVIAMVIALVFSRILTRPIVSLTRSIQRMGRGDFSTRVPVTGSGEIRRLSETFNTMSEKLEMLDQSRNQFVSNASHELKTPLATMKILLESIIYQPDMDSDMRSEFLTDINKEIDRLNMVIVDLLTLVSMDSKTMRLNRTSFSLAQLVTDTAGRLKLVLDQRNQDLKMNLSDRCEMYADNAKLTQVVYNLMENASKYTQEGGTIRVRLIRSGRDAILTVSDNGPGIPKEDQAHIFDRFYRVDKARSRETGGTGLGLSIVHQMVLMHGGTVSVESEEGNGSTFTVELPLHQG